MVLYSWLLVALLLQGTSEPKVTLEYAEGKRSFVPKEFGSVPEAESLNAKSFWIRVKISSETEGSYALRAGNWYMQRIDFFDDRLNSLGTGNNIAIDLKKGITYLFLYYPFADEKDGKGISIKLSSLSDFHQEKISVMNLQFVFISIVSFLFLISAIYSFVIHSADKVYAHYAAYLMTLIIFFSYQYGILGSLFPVITTLQPGWFWMFSDFSTITYIYFTQSFFDLKHKDPLANSVFTVGRYFVFGMAVVESISLLISFDIQHAIFYKGFVIVFQLFTAPFVLYRIYRFKTTLSWFYLLGATVLAFANLSGQIASTLRVVGSINYMVEGGLLAETFIFFIAIGVRMRLLDIEKSNIQSDLIHQLKVNEQIQEKNTAELEGKVMERTETLNQRNIEKELLIKEIHHRVKNNLQVVSSLLNISERKIKDEEIKQPFRDSANRINTMGLIHSYLYQNEDYSNLDLKKYVGQLSRMIIESFRSKYPEVELHLDVGSVKLDMDRAIEIGLIINELVTNSLKHGVYDNRKPVIKVMINRSGERLTLVVSDNGQIEVAREINVDASFGMRMITAMARKLNGTMNIRQENGFEVEVVFEEVSKLPA